MQVKPSLQDASKNKQPEANNMLEDSTNEMQLTGPGEFELTIDTRVPCKFHIWNAGAKFF